MNTQEFYEFRKGIMLGFVLGGCTIALVALVLYGTILLPFQHQVLNTSILSDEEYLRVGINDYFISNFDNAYFPKPDYDVALEDMAVNNAINGEKVWLSVSGNTAEEALTTLITLDNNHYTCDRASFWLITNQRDNPGTKYAIGVHKTSYNQYNISIVIEQSQPDTQELNRNGAWITIHHNPVISNFETYCHQNYKGDRERDDPN
jgi:hypothetical protein